MSAQACEGVLAVHKPTGHTSAGIIRQLQTHFDSSKFFAPWLKQHRDKIAQDRRNHGQAPRRKDLEARVKIGHGGTLDPLATGVLICGFGRGTKHLQDFLACTKSYEAVVIFGASTDTQDRTGKILTRAPHAHITKQMVEKALEQFKGKIMQLPPLYSALKMNGKPLYEYAREGRPIPREIEKRPVEVVELSLVEWYPAGTHEHRHPTEEAEKASKDVAQAVADTIQKQGDAPKRVAEATETFTAIKRKHALEVDDLVSERSFKKFKDDDESQQETMSGGLGLSGVSNDISAPTNIPIDTGYPACKLHMTVTSGFYVRSLCQDLGEAVGSAANMAELVRSRQGQFELGRNVLEFEDLEKGEEIWGPKVASMLANWNAQHGGDVTRDSSSFRGDTDGSRTGPVELEKAAAYETTASPPRRIAQADLVAMREEHTVAAETSTEPAPPDVSRFSEVAPKTETA